MRLATSVLLMAGATGVASAATLELNLAADLYEGGANFEVLADETLVGSGTAGSSEGQSFRFQVQDNVTQIFIRYTNDAALPIDEAGNREAGADRNLVIISASLEGKEWVGTDFIGNGTFARDQRLVLASNTTVTLPIANESVEVSAEGQQPEATVEPALKELSEVAISQPGCDLNIAIVGYTSGVVNLSSDQQSLLAPVLEIENCSVMVTGYSSTSGSEAINEQVALDRAQAVLDYLVQQGGKFQAQQAVSAGETAQFGPKQADNRRVVVHLQ